MGALQYIFPWFTTSSGGGGGSVSATSGGFIYPDTQFGPGETDLILSNSGWYNPRIFNAGDLVMSRGINEHGELAFDLAIDDMVGYVARPDRLRRKWVKWTHPDLGPWIGRIVDARPDANNGVIDCKAVGFTWIMRRRVVPKQARLMTGPPGALVTQALKLVSREEPLPIKGVDADEEGSPITYELRGQQLDAVIRALQSRSNQEWYLDPDTQRFTWRTEYGVDRRHEVNLVDGVHISSYTPYFSLEGVTNALHAQPEDDRYAAARSFWVERTESIDEYGRLEESVSYPGSVTRATVQPIARRDLLRRSRRGRTLTIRVVNHDRVFSLFGIGDTVTVTLSRINYVTPFRVLVQSYRHDTRELTCTGIVP